MSAPTDAAVATKRAARQKPTPSTKEDPRHTWNQQLIEACLACDLARVKELVERGADPVNAREVPPPAFYIGSFGKSLQEEQQQQQQQQVTKRSAEDGPTVTIDAGSDGHNHDAAAGSADTTTAGGGGDGAAAAAATPAPVDRLSPLAIMLLSGLNTLAARRVIAYLIHCGAGVNDTFGFAGLRESVGEGDAVAGAGEDAAAAPRSNTAEAKKGQKKKYSVVASRSNSLGQTAGGPSGGASGEETHAQQGQVECTVEGSVLHYVVSRGDHAQLLRLLLLAAGQPTPSPPSLFAAGRDAAASAASAGVGDEAGAAGAGAAALPYSLLSAVEQETVVGALRYQQMPSLLHPHTGRPLSGSKASGGANADESSALSGTMRSKMKNAQTPAPSGPGSPNLTMISPQSPGTLFVASAASADDVVAVLQQRLQQQSGTVSATQRRLPVLTCAYPYVSDETAAAPLPSTTTAAAGGGGGGGGEGQSGESVLRQALSAMWTLRQTCDATPRTTPPPVAQTPEAITTNPTTTTPMELLSTRVLLDLSRTDSQGRTAVTTALQRGDTLSFRLLAFFGAATPVAGLVNATQTRLARACARGDVTRVEALLRQGDPLAQISADGRYTLIHYAAAHPPVLKVLVEHGLSLEHENVWGETAVLSLQRHGTARNEGRYVHTLFATAAQAAATAAAAAGADGVPAPANSGSAASGAAAPQPPAAPPVSAAVSNAVAFAHMSPAAQRNYILCPPLQLPSLTNPTNERGGGGGGGGPSGRSATLKERSATLKERSASASARRVSPGQSNGTSLYQSSPAAVAAAAVAGIASGAVGGGGDAATGAAASAENAFLGGREAGTWWAFLPPTTTTADAIDTLLKAGAVLQGYIPDDELDLPYVRFAETQAAASAAAGGNRDGRHYSEDWGEAEEAEESYASRASLSGSANTIAPATHASSSRMKGSMMGGPRADPLPGRLPLRVTPLQQAIMDYHPELIRRLVIDYRVDPMQRDSQGATALHYAALCTHAPSVLELLLSPQVMAMHAKVGGTGAPSLPGIGAGGGAASAAAAAAAAAAVAAAAASSGGSGAEAPISIPAAVASKIDLNGTDMAGRTPLFYAALVGNEEAVRLLLRFGALAQVGRGDRDGWTPLHIAVRQQHPTVVELLIRHTKQLLNTAAGAGGAEAFPELLAAAGGSAGARRMSTRSGGSSGGGGGGGSTRRSSHRSASLNNAHRTRRSVSNANGAAAGGAAAAAGAAGGGTSATDLLFANGAVALVDVEAEEKETHMTALEMLIKQTQPRLPASAAQMRMAVVLLSEGQASSLRPSGLLHGGTLLHRVVADGQVELAELLLSYYADPDEVDDADETPLFLAVRQAPTAAETTDSSDGTGSSLEDPTQQQHRRRRRTSLVRVLLQYGATPFAQSALSLETPQHLAARSLAASATDDVEELVQLLFYTAPDRKANAAGGNGASRHCRSENRSRSREHGVLSRVLETMEAESAQQRRGSKRSGRLGGGGGASGGSSAKEAALRRRLNRNSSESGRVDRRHSSMEANGSPGRDRRGAPQQSSKKSGGVGTGQPSSTSPGSAAATHGTSWRGAGAAAAAGGSGRRKVWADEAGGGVDPFDRLTSPTDPPGDDQSSFVNSSFTSVGATNISGFGDDDEKNNNNNNDRSPATSRPDSPDTSTLTTLSQRGDAGVMEGGAEGDADFRRAVLRQWQSPEHLLSAAHCWLLTNARGQTPLHVLCSSACPAVQVFPPLLRLLKDLQTLTVQRDPSLAVVAATPPMGGGGVGVREGLSMLWSLPDAQGRTPLHAAAQSGFAEAVEMILHLSPASVTAVDVQGWTPLHACVLMATDNTTTALPSSTPSAPSSPGDVFHTYHSYSVAESPPLQRIIAALRDALARLSHDGAAVPLMGQPIRRMGRDVFPTPLRTTTTTTTTGAPAAGEGTREPSAATSRLVAALVQPSTITGQLQRWQRTRHWGAPTLLNGADLSGGESPEPQQQQQHRTNALLAKGGSDGVSGWRAYMQLPDGQGRTALLLAAEVGNRSAARELLFQAR